MAIATAMAAVTHGIEFPGKLEKQVYHESSLLSEWDDAASGSDPVVLRESSTPRQLQEQSLARSAKSSFSLSDLTRGGG